MKPFAIALLAATTLLGTLCASLDAQDEKGDVRYFADPNRLLTEKLKPLEKSQGCKAALAEVRNWIQAGIEHPAIFDFEGWQHIGLQDWQSAIQSFDQALKLNKGFSDSLLGRGMSYFQMKQYEKALPDFRARKHNAHRSRMIGLCYLKLNRPVGALNFTQNWRDRIDEEKLESQIADCEKQLAQAWELLAADDLAALHITRALDRGANPDLYLVRAKYLQRQAKFDEAQADIDRAIEIAQPSLYFEIQKLKYLRTARRLEAARDYAKQLLRKYANNEELKQILPKEIGQLENQIATGENTPTKDETQLFKQDYRKAMADKRSAAGVMHASWLVSRGHTKYHVRRARALFNLKLQDLALYDLDAAIANGMGDAGEVHALRAFAIHKQYRPDSKAVVAAYTRAFELGYRLPSDYVIRALHHKKLQMYDEALADWKKSDEMFPGIKTKRSNYLPELKELQALASAKTHMGPFLEPNANLALLTEPMIPTPEIVASVYEGELAETFNQMIVEAIGSSGFVMSRQEDQTKLVLHAAHTEELQDGENFPNDFPGGYRSVARFLKPGLTFVIVEFVEPDKTKGMSYASIVQVDGKWYWFPKPWRFVDENSK